MAYRREERCKRGKKRGHLAGAVTYMRKSVEEKQRRSQLEKGKHHLCREGVMKRHYALWGVAGFAEQAGWFKMRPEQVAGPIMH